MAKKPVKTYASYFAFDCLFSPFCCRFGCAELNGSITMQGNSEDFAWKPPIW